MCFIRSHSPAGLFSSQSGFSLSFRLDDFHCFIFKVTGDFLCLLPSTAEPATEFFGMFFVLYLPVLRRPFGSSLYLV